MAKYTLERESEGGRGGIEREVGRRRERYFLVCTLYTLTIMPKNSAYSTIELVYILKDTLILCAALLR